jgi:hypothetical protein
MNNLIAYLKRNCDSVEYYDHTTFYGKYMGHQIRVFGDNQLEVGHIDFDRWANSVAHETQISHTGIPRQVSMAIITATLVKVAPWREIWGGLLGTT